MGPLKTIDMRTVHNVIGVRKEWRLVILLLVGGLGLREADLENCWI